ncbi:type II secretion system protein GspH [bacterium]|nr:type II secretion system protein GspH [bacterium]
MTSLRQQRSRSGGFTLLELMVVLALLALAGALVAPNLKGLAQGRGPEEESRRLLAALTHARDLARNKGDRIVFWVAADGKSYGLRETRSGRDAFVYTVGERLRVQAFDAESKAVEQQEADASFWPDGLPDDAATPRFQLLENETEVANLTLDTNTRRYVLTVAANAP